MPGVEVQADAVQADAVHVKVWESVGVWIYGYFAIRLTVSQYGRLNG